MQKGFYHIKTYGCQMNVHESEKLAGVLNSLGYVSCDDEKIADIIVFNTCAIRDAAEHKIFSNIGALKKLKQKNPNLIVAVCGCMTQVKGRADVLKQKYPFVNIVFGTHNINEFKNYLINYEKIKNNIYEIWDTEKDICENMEMLRTSSYNAWVNIIYGCNNYCTYCIVPFVRGRERSRKIDDIVVEVKDLISKGYKYITLLGQNVNSYGNDFNDSNVKFSILLETLAKLDGDFKIKFLTSHPKDLSSDVIDVIAKQNKISKFIHLPMQSGSSRILKLMNRKYTKEHYLSLINEIRSKIKNAHITTDVIVGFPGETEDDFNETYEMIKNIEFDGVFAFMYSPRTGTVAEKMENQISNEIKKERVNKILTLSKSIIKKRNQQLVNSIVDVIADNVIEINGQKYYLTYTDSGKSVYVKHDVDIKLCSFYKVKINEFKNNKLYGKFI